jgi:hypothetical protein
MARPKDARRIVVLSQIGEPAWRDAEGWSPLFMDTAHIWTSEEKAVELRDHLNVSLEEAQRLVRLKMSDDMRRDAAELKRIVRTYSLGVKARKGESWAEFIMRCFLEIIKRQERLDETYTEQAAQIEEYVQLHGQLQECLNDALNELKARDLMEAQRRKLAGEEQHLREIVEEQEKKLRGGPAFKAGYHPSPGGSMEGATVESVKKDFEHRSMIG